VGFPERVVRTQGWCLDVGPTVNPYVNPCSMEPAASMPFCDTSLPLATRVANLVGNLTLVRVPWYSDRLSFTVCLSRFACDQDEKLGLFANGADAVPRLNILAYQWWSEALHGVAFSPGVTFGGNIPAASSFPQVITTAASFNASLYHALGTAVGLEARAMNKYVVAALFRGLLCAYKEGVSVNAAKVRRG
jgi:hypothetical protein